MSECGSARDKKTLEFFINETAQGLKAIINSGFGEGWPNFDELINSFASGSVAPSGDAEWVNMQRLLQNKTEGSEDDLELSAFLLLKAACAYCFEASLALKLNNRERAWSSIVDARYISGQISVTPAFTKLRMNAAKEGRQEVARKGGNKRAQAYQPVKEEAYRLCKERCPSKGWHSAKQAAEAIADEVDKFGQGLGIRMGGRLKITLAEWLRLMPDAENIFLSKKKNK